MALQSQMARAGGRGGVGGTGRGMDSGRGSRTGQKQALGFLLLGGLIIGGGYWYMNGRQERAPAAGEPAPMSAYTSANMPVVPGVVPGQGGSGGVLPAATSSKPAPEKPRVEPTVIEMGSRRDPSPSNSSPAPNPVTPASPTPAHSTEPALTHEPAPAHAAPTTSVNPSGMTSEVAILVQGGEKAAAEGRLLDARKQYNAALLSPNADSASRAGLRGRIAELNQTLIFSPAVAPGDAMAESYTAEKGDSLVKIVRKKQAVCEPGLIARVNGMSSPNALRVGQTLKIVRGPFHAVVSKSKFRMDVYQGPTPATGTIGHSSLPDGAEPGWTFVRSFTVGLGEKGITPIGNFFVKESSKLVNPFWVNPRTGEKFDADDPKNPIGERWVGLEGLNLKDKAFTGYGIHGTIDPDSIGKELSMGCVRMGSADVELVYDLLMPRVSVVKIVE